MRRKFALPTAQSGVATEVARLHKERMATFAEYYSDLLRWEEVQIQELIHTWPEPLVQSIKADVSQSLSACGLRGSVCPLLAGSSNQSIGNQVEDFTVKRLGPSLAMFRLDPCPGAGYPDKMLVEKTSRLRMALELKATSDWNPRDSNRRVLTSSSEKVRKMFHAPVYHLMCTVLYTIGQNTAAQIEALRLDFLQPDTAVNVRLEASVSHRILATGDHPSVLLR